MRPPFLFLHAALLRLVGDAHAEHLFGVILAVEDVPLLAAFEDFLLLGRDLLADLGVHFFFVAQQSLEDLDDLIANGFAVFDEFHFIAGDQNIGDLMRKADDFFAAESHSRP